MLSKEKLHIESYREAAFRKLWNTNLNSVIWFVLICSVASFLISVYEGGQLIVRGIFLLFSLLSASFIVFFNRINNTFFARGLLMTLSIVLGVLCYVTGSAVALFAYLGLAICVVYLEGDRNWKIGIFTFIGLSYIFLCYQKLANYNLVGLSDAERFISSIFYCLVTLVFFVGISRTSKKANSEIVLRSVETQRSAQLQARKAKLAADRTKERHTDLVEVADRIKESLLKEQLVQAKIKARQEQFEQFAYASSMHLSKPLDQLQQNIAQIKDEVSQGELVELEIDEHLDYLSSSSSAMEAVLRKYLLYSESGRKRVYKESCDLYAVWRESLTLSPYSDADLRIDDTVDAGLKNVSVSADRKDLETSFLEILANAKLFERSGKQLPVLVLESENSHTVTFSVKDFGIGIETEYLTYVFGLFKRLHNREKYPGSGVGLTIVKRLVGRMGGHVSLESKVGEWTKVLITLDKV